MKKQTVFIVTCAFAFISLATVCLTNTEAKEKSEDESRPRSTIIIDGNGIVLEAGKGKTLPRVSTATQRPKYWIGIAWAPVSPTLKAQLKLDSGAAVVQVMDDSPAAKAGIQPHDVIVSIDGKPIHGLAGLMQAVEKAGEKPAKVTIVREGKRQQVMVTPIERPDHVHLLVAPWTGNAGEHAAQIKKWVAELQKQNGDKGIQMFRFGRPFILKDGEIDVEFLEVDPENAKKQIEEFRKHMRLPQNMALPKPSSNQVDDEWRKEMESQLNNLRKQVKQLQKRSSDDK